MEVNNSQLPEHVQRNLSANKLYYSMDDTDNMQRAKVDEEYLGEAVLVNENLIWHSVHKYLGHPDVITRNNALEKDDILQLGRMGFLKSVKAFDITRGVKFSSFAVTAIVREIRCYLRDSANIIRPTRTANDILNRVRRIEHQLGYTPSTEDLSVLLDEDEEKITKALQIGQSVKYLDEPLTNLQSQDITYLDTIESFDGDIEEEVLDKVYIDSIIEVASKKLSEKEVQVLKHRIGGYNQTQTAKRENISQMRVSRIMRKVAEILHEEAIMD